MFQDLLNWFGFRETDVLTLSKYNYNSTTHTSTYKKYFRVSAGLASRLDISDPEYEFGLCSSVFIDNNECLLRQIDCKTQDIDRLREVLKNRLGVWGYVGEAYRIYDSGNSYHVYLKELRPSKSWLLSRYLSELILRDPGDVFDTRWIAHSIYDNMSNLRITSNTGDKKKVPELIYEEKIGKLG